MSGIILLVLRIAMTVALYALLGWILLLMWRTLKQEAFFLSSRKTTPLVLELEMPAVAPQIFRFTTGDVLVGRDPDCECVLTDETISARHVRFVYRHNQWWVEDLGSRNGTGLNGAPLTTATILVNGDTIKCGETKLRVVLETDLSPEDEEQTPPMESNT
jgi:pSer/pThr/pTyr-binding forkhead associated (FHA) protein